MELRKQANLYSLRYIIIFGIEQQHTHFFSLIIILYLL
jgi:hypothetical protein